MSTEPAETADDELAEPGLGRLLALSDGVFAIAITLLVLNLDIPPGLSGQDYDRALHELLPSLGTAGLTFLIIGRFWIGHHRLFSYIRRVDRRMLQLNLLLLAPMVFLPFGTELINRYGDRSSAVIIYAAAISFAGLVFVVLWMYATWHRRLVDSRLDRRLVMNLGVQYASSAAVFLASMPIALVSPHAAEWFWLGMLVVATIVNRLRRH